MCLSGLQRHSQLFQVSVSVTDVICGETENFLEARGSAQVNATLATQAGWGKGSAGQRGGEGMGRDGGSKKARVVTQATPNPEPCAMWEVWGKVRET